MKPGSKVPALEWLRLQKQIGVSAIDLREGIYEFRKLVAGLPASLTDTRFDRLRPGVVRVMVSLDVELGRLLDARIDGGKLLERAAVALPKLLAQATSADRKQARVAVTSVAALLRSHDPGIKKAKTFASIIELIEELPPPRSARRVRIKATPGRRSTDQGAATKMASDRNLVGSFARTNGRWPSGFAEWASLAPEAGGDDSRTEYPVSTVQRMQRNTKAMRRGEI